MSEPFARSNKYYNIHQWLITKYGNAYKCENRRCMWKNPKRFEYALKRGKDYAKIRSNYKMLCPSCHRRFDVTKATREKISKSLFGNHRKPTKAVVAKRGITKIHFVSIAEAAKKMNVWRTGIHNCLKGRSQTCGGFKWFYGTLNKTTNSTNTIRSA